MKRARSLKGWCGLGLAVVVVAGGAYVCKRYAEQHMLAAVLGSGVHAESVQWHWRQSAGCAEQVEIPLAHATDLNDQALELFAPKLWFVYDQAAMLRKRFVLPRVIIEDALISTSSDRLMAAQIVDIGFDAGVDLSGLSELVEVPEASAAPKETSVVSSESSVGESTVLFACKATGKPLAWADELQANFESVGGAKSISGRQVSIDADMISERIQAYFTDCRTHAQTLISEARDLHQQLVNTDNMLRQPQMEDTGLRLERIHSQLNKLKDDIGNSGKQLSVEHSRLRQALLIEKTELIKQADAYQAPEPREVAQAILDHLVREQMKQPARAVVMLSDIMRKPFDMPGQSRGQQIRAQDNQPDFAARSARISGKLEIEGTAWPFNSEGMFEVSSQGKLSGNSKWRMSIEAQPDTWQLTGECPSIDEPCVITFSSSAPESMHAECRVEGAKLSCSGHFLLRPALARDGLVAHTCQQFASGYRAEGLLCRMISDSLVVNDQTPEMVEFQLDTSRPTDSCKLSDAAVDWLAVELQTTGTACMAETYRQAAAQLDALIAGKLTDQVGLMATLRKDCEQYLAAQQDELRRLRVMAKSLMEQRQTNFYSARQAGDLPR